MDLLSTTDIFPSRVTAVIRFLLAQRGQSANRDALLGSLSPASLGERTRMIDNNVEACIEMGIVEASPTDELQVRLSPTARAAFPKNTYDADAARLLLAAPICRADEGGSQAFCSVVAWFLANDPLTFDAEYEAVCRQLARVGRSDYLSLRNVTRYEQTTYWSVYAGFAWSCARPDGKTVPVFDPTEHLALVLPGYCLGQDKNGVPIVDLCAAMARDWPVYPGGHYWSGIADALAPGAHEPGRLAPALHLAFRRLERRGWVRLTALSDAPGLGTPAGRLTHVMWSRKKGAR